MKPEQAWRGEVLVLSGDIEAGTARAWRTEVEAMATRRPGRALDLSELELLDGVSVAEAVNLLRAIQAAWGRIELVEAPQMLAHTLYKVGALGPDLVLRRPRTEDGTTAG